MTDPTGTVTLRHRTGEGCELVCDVVPGDGPPVVVLSGATGTRQISRMMMTGLEGRRQLVLPDPRGHGESSCRHPGHYTWRGLMDDAYLWLDRLDITGCALVGTSLGAVVATGIVVERPELVSSLALTNPAVLGADVPMPPTQADAVEQLHASFGVEGPPDLERVAAVMSGISGMAPEAILQRLAMHADPESVACYFRSADLATIPFTTGDLTRIRQPTLVLPGADLVHTAEVGARTAALIPHAETPDMAALTAGATGATEFREIVFGAVASWLLGEAHTVKAHETER